MSFTFNIQFVRRLLYGGVGIYALTQYYSLRDPIFLLIGLLLIFQAIFNVTCLGGACQIPRR